MESYFAETTVESMPANSPFCHPEAVIKHPSADHGIKHNKEIVSGDCKPSCKMPTRSFRFQYVIRCGDAFLACASYTEFTYDDR